MFPQLARCPPIPNSKIEQGLADLGRAMGDDDPDQNDPAMAPAGYTYFGQFIDHDLTFDITPLELAHIHAEGIRNFRNPFLNLEHVYAGGPNISPFLYELNGPPGNERFLIGLTGKRKCKKTGEIFDPSPDDLPRNSRGVALVGDPRQDENLLIAQLHVAFLKFHNRVMEELENEDKGKPSALHSAGPARATRFERARRFVTWTYQYLVLNDFLSVLLDTETFKETLRECAAGGTARTGEFGIPIEFSSAAFRFGHSMVRDIYGFYNRYHENVGLRCLVALVGSGADADACADQHPSEIPRPFVLPADWAIEWGHFFVFPLYSTFNHARRVDTRVATGLLDLKMATVSKFSAASVKPAVRIPSPLNVLPVRTLWRGVRMGLPSGQDIAKACCVDPLDPERDIAPGPHEQILRSYGFQRDTPLWYYILKEAEIKRFGNGLRLGPVGSRIVGTVIANALHADPDSFLSIEPKWKPMLNDSPVQQMRDVLEFVS